MKKFLINIILNTLFIILSSLCFAQINKIDSLKSLLLKDKPDTNKVIHLNYLFREYINIGSYDTAIRNGNKALLLAQKLNFKKGIATSYHNLGIVYDIQGNYLQALEYCFKTLKLDEELQDEIGIANCLGNIGNVFTEKGDYLKALDFYFKALKIEDDLQDKNGIARNLGNIMGIYYALGNFTKAIEYGFKALKMAEDLGEKNLIAKNIGNIGAVYDGQKNYPKALEYEFRALKMAEEIGDKQGILADLGNIGLNYFAQKDYPKALIFTYKALKLSEELGDKESIAINLSSLGLLYSATGKFREAEQCLMKSIIIDDSIGALNNLMVAENMISHLYDTTGRYNEALIHYKKAVALKDTIFSQENKKELVRKEMNYEFEKKEAITKAENEKLQAIAEEKNRKQKIISLSVACGLLLVFVFAGFILRSLRITRKQKQIIEIKNIETEHQKKIIEEKNKDIIDSIRYAKRIQNALLREEEHISMHLPEHFILFMPKDIVSGDFYWGAEKNGFWYFAAVDCTGHGVPGAIMSMLGISFLNDIVSAEGLLSPAKILNHLRDKVVKELRQTGETGGSKDGMDISLCRLNIKTNELQWAGANNSLNIFWNGKLEEVKPDKQPIGYHLNNSPFTNHEIKLQKGDNIYIYTDGYADQFGGPKARPNDRNHSFGQGKKFTYKKLENLIVANNNLPMKEQKEILKKCFNEWKGSLEQVDDVTIFGIRI